MLKRFESFVPRNVDDRQEKGRIMREEKFKELKKWAEHFESKFKSSVNDDRLHPKNPAEKFFINKLKNSKIKIGTLDGGNMLHFFDTQGKYLASCDFDQPITFWFSQSKLIDTLQDKFGLSNFGKLEIFIKNCLQQYFDFISNEIEYSVEGRDEYIESDYKDGLYHNINESLDDRIKKEWLPKYLYHVTPEENVNKILKNGIIPKEGGRTFLNRKYSPRVYLATSLIAAYDLQVNFNAHDNIKYSIIKIDTSKIPNFDFYDDDKFVHGIWTSEKIPASSIFDVLNPNNIEYREEDLETLYYQDWHDYDEPQPLRESTSNDSIIAYHGTNHKFGMFNDEKPMFFVDDKNVAKTYGSFIVKVELIMDNPIEFDFDSRSTYYFMDKWYLPSELAIKIKEISNDIKKHYTLSDDVKDELEHLGFSSLYGNLDGIIMKNINDSFDMFSSHKLATNYVVFDKKQIKVLKHDAIKESFTPRKIDKRREDRIKLLKKRAKDFKQKIDELKTLKGEDRVEKDFINFFKDTQVRYWPIDQFIETVFFFYDGEFDACYDFSNKHLTCSKSLLKTFNISKLEDLFVSMFGVDAVSVQAIFTSPEIYINNNKDRMVIESFVPRTEEREKRRKE